MSFPFMLKPNRTRVLPYKLRSLDLALYHFRLNFVIKSRLNFDSRQTAKKHFPAYIQYTPIRRHTRTSFSQYEFQDLQSVFMIRGVP